MDRFGLMQNGHIRDMESGEELELEAFISRLNNIFLMQPDEVEHIYLSLRNTVGGKCEFCNQVIARMRKFIDR